MSEKAIPMNTDAGRLALILIRLLCSLSLLYTGLVFLISFSSLFFYTQFAEWLGSPMDAILKLNPWLVRLMMLGGSLIYGSAAAGCILMLRFRKKGFWLYAIPAFIIITASLFVIFNPINLIQLSLMIVSVISLSVLTAYMK